MQLLNISNFLSFHLKSIHAKIPQGGLRLRKEQAKEKPLR
jgi:hypothetical protein